MIVSLKLKKGWFVKNTVKFFSIFALALLVSNVVSAASQVWKDSESSSQSNKSELKSRSINSAETPFKYRSLALDMSMLDRQLDSSLSARSVNDTAALPVIEIPLPQGGMVRVKAESSAVMAPELAVKFPQIRTWRVIGLDDENIHGVIDITEHGFHAMLTMPNGDTVYVDPDKKPADNQVSNNYLSFSKRDNSEHFKTDFQCRIHSDHRLDNIFVEGNKRNVLKQSLASRVAQSKITYRLALAATAEYTQYHGGTISRAQSAIVTTVNRVNEVYQRDLGIFLQLIGDETKIIYTNANTDPYTNGDTNAMLDENLLNLSNNGDLGHSNYDIGHVFGSGNVGGLAALGSTCHTLMKSGGVTSINNPIGDAFNIDYVAHEMGHQLGGTHTFNSSCGGGVRTQTTAVEPGSGSTIMGYAGVCSASNDLQAHSDSQFHAVSITQISNYTRSGNGSQCGAEQGVSNQDPQVNAGSNYTVPAITPFMLVATGSDSDRDTLSYTWEQSDTGTMSNVDVDTGDNALIRSRPANISGTRYIPRLIDLFNTNGVRGERLPVNDRDLTFIATARDGKGGLDTDEMIMHISSTGRTFSVTSHVFDETLSAGDQTRVTWDTAGTHLSPVSCSQVDISFVQSDGTKAKLTTTANDGGTTLTIPDTVPEMNDARLMLSCNNNLFFNVSFGTLTIRNEGGSSGSSGGSFGFLLMPLMMIALLRRKNLRRKSYLEKMLYSKITGMKS